MNTKFQTFLYFIGGSALGFLIWSYTLFLTEKNPCSEAVFNQHIIENKISILKQAKKNKIVILSGSNALFGFNAKTIEKDLKIQTINCGIHAGFNLDFLLWLTNSYFTEGDIVIMPLEYNIYKQNISKPSRSMVNIVHGYYPKYKEKLSFIERMKFSLTYSYTDFADLLYIKYNPAFDEKFIQKWSINNHGDIVNNHKSQRSDHIKLKLNKVNLNKVLTNGLDKSCEGFTTLKKFFFQANSKGVKVVGAFPNLCYWVNYENYPSFYETPNQIKSFFEEHAFGFIGKFKDSHFTNDYFFDTENHLTHEGVKIRTKNLILNLKALLKFGV